MIKKEIFINLSYNLKLSDELRYVINLFNLKILKSFKQDTTTNFSADLLFILGNSFTNCSNGINAMRSSQNRP